MGMTYLNLGLSFTENYFFGNASNVEDLSPHLPPAFSLYFLFVFLSYKNKKVKCHIYIKYDISFFLNVTLMGKLKK